MKLSGKCLRKCLMYKCWKRKSCLCRAQEEIISPIYTSCDGSIRGVIKWIQTHWRSVTARWVWLVWVWPQRACEFSVHKDAQVSLFHSLLLCSTVPGADGGQQYDCGGPGVRDIGRGSRRTHSHSGERSGPVSASLCRQCCVDWMQTEWPLRHHHNSFSSFRFRCPQMCLHGSFWPLNVCAPS